MILKLLGYRKYLFTQMRTKGIFILSAIVLVFTFSSFDVSYRIAINQSNNNCDDQLLVGKWVRIGSTGPLALIFEMGGRVDVDLGNNGTIDITSRYQIDGNMISFMDENGAMCHEPGVYKIFLNNYYAAFDLVEDNCGGRIKSTMGYWTRTGFKELITELSAKISDDPQSRFYLSRARVYLAVGQLDKAQTDLDVFLGQIDNDPTAYLNRAATKMPGDLHGVIDDCNRTIELDSKNKNAYFLRGLARYEMGAKDAACEDFEKAIKLGFSVLRIAEQEKCASYWKDDQ